MGRNGNKIRRVTKKVFTMIHKGYLKITCKLAGAFGYDTLMDDYMKAMCKTYEKSSDYYVAYKIRPKTEEKIFTIEEENGFDALVGIVMQGPIFMKDHFTLETVRIYGKLFPSAKVVISTWGGVKPEELELIKKEKNAYVLINEKPEDPGILNSNLQCISTLNGIRKAKELGCKYVLKTRGDWRIYAKGALRFMIHLLDLFPCSDNELKQNQRIIAADIATEETSIMFYPFWITDLLMFGNADDMERYWNSSLTKREGYNKAQVDAVIRSQKYSWKRRVEEGLLNEARIPMDYIRRVTGRVPEISVKEYWQYMRRYFLIVPKSLLDAFWLKYEDRRTNESSDWGTCFINDNQDSLLTYNFDFVSWLNLYSEDLEYKEEYEEFCQKRVYQYR